MKLHFEEIFRWLFFFFSILAHVVITVDLAWCPLCKALPPARIGKILAPARRIVETPTPASWLGKRLEQQPLVGLLSALLLLTRFTLQASSDMGICFCTVRFQLSPQNTLPCRHLQQWAFGIEHRFYQMVFLCTLSFWTKAFWTFWTFWTKARYWFGEMHNIL